MKYNTLGNTGLIVSRMAFGALTFGSSEGPLKPVHKVDQELANRLVGMVIDSGINFFNTADAYANGQSEEMLGKALRGRRHEVVISTKVGFRAEPGLLEQGLSRHHIMASVEGSLKRLGTDYIDVYLLHRLDRYTPLEESLETLNDLVRQGKVRYVGFSNWPAWIAAKTVGLQQQHGWTKFRAAEMYYSLVGRDLEHEVVPFAEDAGIGLMIWSPLAGGFLSGKYTKENPGGNGGRLAGFDLIPFNRDEGFAVVDLLKQIGQAHGASPAAVALAWLLTKPYVSSILIGATKESQLQDNLKAADLEVAAGELEALEQLTRPEAIYPNWFRQIGTDDAVEKALAAHS